jgi:DMSO/TMAO reductase YedYZ molybdopterin-dependent catalytic subunit
VAAPPAGPVAPGQNVSRPISRRGLLAGGAFAVAGLSLWATTNALELLAGGRRRFTGSRLLAPGSMPIATTFLGEPTPAIDAASWHVTVEGVVARPMRFELAALQALGDREIRAVLDCTSGWAVDTTWRGVPLASVLEAAGTSSSARRVDITSVTGWATSIDVAEARDGLLAWSVGGQPLPVANGAPIRLVLPNRRGLDWVKWVGAIRIE